MVENVGLNILQRPLLLLIEALWIPDAVDITLFMPLRSMMVEVSRIKICK